jgi:hypothetical protein
LTGEALRQGLISEQTIRDALTISKGDLFLASAYLGVTARELDGYIRASEEIQGFVAAIATVKKDANYARMSAEQFADRLEQVARAYRVEALDIIHDLASIPLNKDLTAAMADVKLKAAIQLRGANAETPHQTGQANVLAELNQLYLESAPRIKSVRIAQIEYQSESS